MTEPKNSSGKLETSFRRTVTHGSVKSALDKYSMDPFHHLGGDGQPEFGKEGGYRGREVPGLLSGPFTTSIINGIVARKRSRYAVLTNPHAKRGIDILVSNVVGAGHRMVSLCPDEDLRQHIEKLWIKWCTECDTTGQLSYGGVESLAFRSAIEGGDCFVRMRNRRPEDNLSVPLQLQVIESEQVPMTMNEYRGRQKIVAGIQYDVLGKPVGYHFYPNHPGDYLAFISGEMNANTVFVPADDVAHLHEVRRPMDGRGLPMLSQMVIRLSDLDRYLDAELVRKKAAALIGGFIKAPQSSEMDNPFLTDRDPDDIREVDIEPLEPGSFPILPPGYEVSFSQPVDVGQNFQVFLKQELLTIAASLNITYEQLTGDLRDVNDRTLRASMLEFKRFAINLQEHILIHQFHNKIFRRWFQTAVLAGAITIPADMSYEDASAVKWVADPWKYLNPTQEIQAETMEIRAGLKAWDDAILERGGVPEEVERRIAATNKRHADLGLTFDVNPAKVSKSGVTNARPGDHEEGPDPEEDPTTDDESGDSLVDSIPESGQPDSGRA